MTKGSRNHWLEPLRLVVLDVLPRGPEETIRAFHLDNPDATWHQLREHLIWIAEGLLSSAHDVYSLRMWGDLYEDVAMNLTEIAATMPLSVDQHEHVTNAKRVMVAAQDRLRGDSVPLVTIIKDLEGEKYQQAKAQALDDSSEPQSVRGPALTFEDLSRLYLADRAGEQKATTLMDLILLLSSDT